MSIDEEACDADPIVLERIAEIVADIDWSAPAHPHATHLPGVFLPSKEGWDH